MYYGQLIEDCVSDGPGFRVSLEIVVKVVIIQKVETLSLDKNLLKLL